jgi:tetraacyldisaccharide 4'-kinase
VSNALGTFAERYWNGELHAAGTGLHVVLAPAELVFRALVAARARAYDRALLHSERAPIPVVSIGNIAVGGAGKTPFTQWIARELRARGARPAIVHGGYAEDEPALHRQWSPDIPVIVGRDRVRAARTAAAQGADIAVLDDAFQHRRLQRDLDIVLVSAERDGPLRMLPRGPLREPLDALRRADLVIVTRKAATMAVARALGTRLQEVSAQPIVHVQLRPDSWLHQGEAAPPPAEPALLVCAIAEPRSFEQSAQHAGARIAARALYPDHHDYTAADAAEIMQRAGTGPVVTTEKDWMKLQHRADAARVWILTQTVVIESGADIIDAALAGVMHAQRSR